MNRIRQSKADLARMAVMMRRGIGNFAGITVVVTILVVNAACYSMKTVELTEEMQKHC